MDPNNLDNNQNSAPENVGANPPSETPVEPALVEQTPVAEQAPAETVLTEQTPTEQVLVEPTPVEQTPAEPTQTTTEPTQPAQTVAEPIQPTQPAIQPVQPMAQPIQPEPKKPNSKTISIIVAAVLVLGIVGTIIALFATGVISFGGSSGGGGGNGGGGGGNNSTPTMELAKSVCEKYGGSVRTTENIEGSFDENFENAVECDNLEAKDESKQFAFGIYFLKDEVLESYWEDSRKAAVKQFDILENSDTYLKGYLTTPNKASQHGFALLYKNAVAEVGARSGSFAEDLIVELGFPNRSRKTSF